MKILKAYKYRMYPTGDQKVLINKTFGCCRVLWNRCVELFNQRQDIPSSTIIKSDYEWMSEVSAAALQQKSNDFREFQRQFFNTGRKRRLGSCRFKSKYDRQSYRLPGQKFTLGSSFIRLEKIGKLAIKMDRRPKASAEFRSVTVSKNSDGKFYVSVLVREPHRDLPETGRTLGIDVGLNHFATLSDGTKIANPRFFRESQAELRKAQRRLSRKKKGSVRRKKCKLKVARLHRKTTDQRKHFLHVLSSRLIRDYDRIGIEDLNVAGMLRNRKLAKSISDASWSLFASFLEYKARWNGRTVQRVGRFFPSSKMCNCCGLVKPIALNDRNWICDCGNLIDRDTNAALNIRDEAIRLLAQGVACA
jgi:putative transposase